MGQTSASRALTCRTRTGVTLILFLLRTPPDFQRAASCSWRDIEQHQPISGHELVLAALPALASQLRNNQSQRIALGSGEWFMVNEEVVFKLGYGSHGPLRI